MSFSMATDNAANFFNILAPGENEVAMFNGSVSENQYEGILPESGDYKLRVYMTRSAARRNEVANYRLEMIITAAADTAADGRLPEGEGTPAGPPSRGDALVPGTNYHASGNIPCAMPAAQPTGFCPFW